MPTLSGGYRCSSHLGRIFFVPSLTKPDTLFPGDNKDSANGDTAGLSSKKSSATRMVTRLRNPESKLSQLKNQQVAAAVHEANKGFKEGKEVRRAVGEEDDGDVLAGRDLKRNVCAVQNTQKALGA